MRHHLAQLETNRQIKDLKTIKEDNEINNSNDNTDNNNNKNENISRFDQKVEKKSTSSSLSGNFIYIGIIILDFPDKDLIKRIIKLNFEKDITLQTPR
jgi:hypothetical protein